MVATNRNWYKPEPPPDLWGAPCISVRDAASIIAHAPHEAPPDFQRIALFSEAEAAENITFFEFLGGGRRIGR